MNELCKCIFALNKEWPIICFAVEYDNRMNIKVYHDNMFMGELARPEERFRFEKAVKKEANKIMQYTDLSRIMVIYNDEKVNNFLSI